MAEATAIVTSIPPKPATPASRYLHVYNDGDAMRVSEDFWALDEAVEYLGDTDRGGYAYSVEMTPAGPVKRDLEDDALDWRAEQRAEMRSQARLAHWYAFGAR